MNTTNQVLDRIKSNLDLSSDYALAKVLGVGQSCITNYRKKRSQFDDAKAYKAAKLAEIDPVKLITTLHNERSASCGSAELWQDIEKKYELINAIKKQDVITAIKAAATGKTSPAQREILGRISEQCILC